MAAKISKLENQFQDTARLGNDRLGIFKGISIFVNGHTGIVRLLSPSLFLSCYPFFRGLIRSLVWD